MVVVFDCFWSRLINVRLLVSSTTTANDKEQDRGNQNNTANSSSNNNSKRNARTIRGRATGGGGEISAAGIEGSTSSPSFPADIKQVDPRGTIVDRIQGDMRARRCSGHVLREWGRSAVHGHLLQDCRLAWINGVQ